MDASTYIEYCLSLPYTEESFPFNETTIVFKVGNKIYSLANIEPFESFNVKCDPEMAIELRSRYAEVKPGYHMNKRHWNTVEVNGHLSDTLLKEWILNSYIAVKSSLPKKVLAALEAEDEE
ncbi:MmcQ/YjbR family DNA-binding protein [Membranihabitans marinus]|uniref:MmcQ/YjbR family DNA-binding protein n=1 Tax=Membranihabitans marinus TaxID=1227546 RepID=UPI001F1D8B21|nr:MmcQ/YjbR family DNA-binding protein [Membranihabitans marinus]